MSIKSQKSLYEECSEIIERSYSVRSWSGDSLSSCDDEDECLARELMMKMTPAMLSKLRRSFRKSKERKIAADIDRRVEEVMRRAAAEEGIEFAAVPAPAHDPLWLDEGGFVAAVNNIFGDHKYSPHATKLFQLLDPLRTGQVRWRLVLERLVAVGARATRTRADVWTPVAADRVQRLEHCKRETLVKLVLLEREESFCYAAVTRGGRVGLYSGCMQLMHSYEVFYHKTGMQRRVRNCWITDAVYLSDVQSLILSASDRSLTVYDASTLTHTPVYCITGLPNIPTCMAYSPMTSELCLGSERGDLTRIMFLQPRASLFHINSPDHINCYFWMELTSPPHTSYCTIQTWRRVHARSVRRVAYIKHGEYILSCSHDNNVSMRLKHVPGKLDDYVFKLPRGVTCFHMVPSLHLIASGSSDGTVRLWESTQPAPFATLAAPPSPAPAGILDVAVLAASDIVVGYTGNCNIHIWDLHEECLLQTVRVRFPFLGVLGKKVEFGAFCIHPGPVRQQPSEVEESVDPLPQLESTSRRTSGVYQGSTGGMMLQPEEEELRTSGSLHDDEEYKRFNRAEILVSCCDFVSTVQLRPPSGVVLPPPGDTLRARRPSYWDLPDDVFKTPPLSPKPPRSPSPLPHSIPTTLSPLPHSIPTTLSTLVGGIPTIPSSMLLSPTTAEHSQQDLETLLKNAGLDGILEKDFVLMQGLKHDLNRKLAHLKTNMHSMRAAVSMGAPYLALSCGEPTLVPQLDLMMERYRQVSSLFPETSLTGTPTVSNTSTPRKRNSTQNI